MKILNKLLLNKKKGVGDMIVCVLSIVILSFVLILSIDSYRNISLAIQKKNIERRYLLLLETQGYLSDIDQQALVKDLEGIGVTDIQIENDTPLGKAQHVGYGNVVKLHVSGKIRTYARTGFNIENGWKWRGGEIKNDFKIYQESTAKY